MLVRTTTEDALKQPESQGNGGVSRGIAISPLRFTSLGTSPGTGIIMLMKGGSGLYANAAIVRRSISFISLLIPD